MAYYYVKNGGTATGDAGRYASQQTGSFTSLGASSYYNDIQDAIAATTSPAAGDFVNVSDLHSYSQGTAITYTGIEFSPFFIVCVDDANIDAGRTSGNRGKESTTGSLDINYSNVYISGLEFEASEDSFVGRSTYFSDCKIVVPGPSDRLLMTDDISCTHLENCELALDDASASVHPEGGSAFYMFGGSVTTVSAGVSNFIDGHGDWAGWNVHVVGADLTAVTGNLVGNIPQNDGVMDIRFDMCKIDSGASFVNTSFKSQLSRALFTRCSDTSALAEHQYHLSAYGGVVDDDATIRRDDDPAFEDSATKISYKIATNSNASLGGPLWFDFPNPRWAALSAGATDTLRFYLASTSALTDKDVYVSITYPDGTNKQTPTFFSSAPSNQGGTLDLMATGTTLTSDSASDWRDGASALSGYNEYQIDVATSGDTGADTVPCVRVFITKPSITIQLASIYDLN